MDKPILAVTMGDPCGIGPEVTARALAKPGLNCRAIVVGSAEVLRRAIEITGVKLRVKVIADIGDAVFDGECINALDIPINIAALEFGKVSAEGGEAGFRAVEKAIRLALAGAVDATVTGPINKEALNLAGYHYSGHTEIYAEMTGTRDYCMMLADGDLRVAHVSTHASLRRACDLCTKARVLATIRLAHAACLNLGLTSPRVAVAGLNPHAGENGLFGREEIEEIAPAVRAAREEGMIVEGPLPADTVFSKANGGMYDIVVAQYHDQGHIPLKALGFRMDRQTGRWDNVTGVNITLGLPIIRTAVDHGTAFDQAGKGTASEISMSNAIDYAIKLARRVK